jgi:beta-glucosidase
VVLSVGLNQDWESEGDDRPTLHLPMRTDELVFKVAEANPNTIVVIQGGSAVAMPWLDKVKGVVQAWYGGGEAGTGIADIIYGHVNPSGRLALTFPKRNLDNPAALSFKSFNGKTYYEEGIWVGYRHYNAREFQPLFPFGFGLSYTTFEYENLKITSVSPKGTNANEWNLEARVTVKNTGAVSGSHSVHFYLSPPPETATGLKHPEHTLQAFTKVYDLGPGQSKTVEVEMNKCERLSDLSADSRCYFALGRGLECLASRAGHLDRQGRAGCSILLWLREVRGRQELELVGAVVAPGLEAVALETGKKKKVVRVYTCVQDHWLYG